MAFFTVLCLAATPAMAINDFWSKVLSSGATTGSTYLTSSSDKKMVMAIQDDASIFVASNGAIRGPYLEAAMQKIRTAHPELNVSDVTLASALLAQNSDS
jgi:uncharacterized protein (TIGR02448 family)